MFSQSQSGSLAGSYQYPITVDDGVEPVGDGENCTLPELVPDGLLDQAVGSEGGWNTTPR